jgi:3-hydroxyacyl-[acyl-carrier-protein] dehydratase
MLDRIVELEPGARIVGERNLTGREDYLADHFPLFPVMPGVLMLEAMFQVASWLIRVTDQFEHPLVILREARNIKYSDFVVPGQTLVVSAEIVKRDGLVTTLKAQGMVNGNVAVGGRLVLESLHLNDQMKGRSAPPAWANKMWRDLYQKLTAHTTSQVPISV